MSVRHDRESTPAASLAFASPQRVTARGGMLIVCHVYRSKFVFGDSRARSAGRHDVTRVAGGEMALRRKSASSALLTAMLAVTLGMPLPSTSFAGSRFDFGRDVRNALASAARVAI